MEPGYGIAGLLAFPLVLLLASFLTARVRRIRPGIYCVLLGFLALLTGAHLAGAGHERLGYFLLSNGSADMTLGALLLLAGKDGVLLRYF
ncbi:MAG: hypothetical protein GXO66_10470 [Euryarchaeota archaeon]|nr:hypothetical protein [Euryarchaeota archaeon]